MMKKKSLYLGMLLLMMCTLTSSCDEHWWSLLVGRWELVSYVEGGYERGLYPGEYEEYHFRDDGTGEYYAAGGVYTTFYWDEIESHRVELRHSDGLVERFYFEKQGDYLSRSDTPSFYNYTLFYRTRTY